MSEPQEDMTVQDHMEDLDDLWGPMKIAGAMVKEKHKLEEGNWAAPEPVSLDMEIEEKIPWAIGPCIAPGDCVYFVGQDSEGKTTLVVDILWGMLAGPDFDNPAGEGSALHGCWNINREYFPHGSRALVLNGETTGPSSWARKLAECGLSREINPMSEADLELRKRADFLNRDEVLLRKEHLKADATAFAHWIGAMNYRLVIIDPIYNFWDPDDNGDSSWVSRGLSPFVIALKQYGITCLCIAHPSAIAMQKGRKGGPRLQQVYTPFGSTQQKNVHDARFGVARLDKDQQTVEILKLKDRRETDAWIPKLDSRLRLAFSANGAGYSAGERRGSGWEIDDPTGGVVLGASVNKMLAVLPAEPFGKETVEEVGIRRQNWTHARDTFLFPQGILTSEVLSKPGAPLRYSWTEKGLRARECARKNFPYEVAKQEAEPS